MHGHGWFIISVISCNKSDPYITSCTEKCNVTLEPIFSLRYPKSSLILYSNLCIIYWTLVRRKYRDQRSNEFCKCIVAVITLHWPSSMRLADNGQSVLLQPILGGLAAYAGDKEVQLRSPEGAEGCRTLSYMVAMPTSFPQRSGKPVTWRHARNSIPP